MKPRTRRILHRTFFTFAVLGTLFVLFYAEENWRGARAWAAAKRDLQARGETLERQDLIPPPVPDAQNLAMAPLFARMFQYAVDPSTGVLTFSRDRKYDVGEAYTQAMSLPWGKTKAGVNTPYSPSWVTGHATDLAGQQQYFRQRPDFPHPAQPQTPAKDVLLALTRWSPLLDELAQSAAERPLTRFPINYMQRPAWGINLPHYLVIQRLASTLRMRAVAELADHQTAAARRDLALTFRLRQATAHDPVLVAGLVDVTVIGISIQPIWEGLAARQWSADDLDVLRGELRNVNVLEDFRRGVRGERAFFVARWPDDAQGWEWQKILNNGASPPWYSPQRWLGEGIPGWPRGWSLQNAAFACHYLQEYGIDTVDPAAHRVMCAKAKQCKQAIAALPATPTTTLVRLALPVYDSLYQKFAQMQATVDQALAACALERFYLDHHVYPAALADLVPTYLDRAPNDVIDGAPMRYRRTVDGRYQLYSIAWDEKDDGGALDWPPDRVWRGLNSALPGDSTPRIPSPVNGSGDWVWQYAPAVPPDPPANRSRLESLPSR